MKGLLACTIVFLALAWTTERVQASSVSIAGGTISFCKAAGIAGLGAGDGMKKIQDAIYTEGGDGGGGGGGGGGDSEGILNKGLDLLKSLVIVFLGIYGIYLGVSIAFGQADGSMIASFFFGTMMALGAQAISGFYEKIFK